MKRFVAVAVTVGLLAGALAVAPAEAKKRKKPKKQTRTEEGSYNGGTGVLTIYPINHGGYRFATATTEAYVMVELVDTTGADIGFNVGQDPDGDLQADIVGSGCGKTALPIPIQPGVEVTVFVGDLTLCPEPSPATVGTITVTFSNIP